MKSARKSIVYLVCARDVKTKFSEGNKMEEQDKLFDLINENGLDMEDLIELISYKEVTKLIGYVEEIIKQRG